MTKDDIVAYVQSHCKETILRNSNSGGFIIFEESSYSGGPKFSGSLDSGLLRNFNEFIEKYMHIIKEDEQIYNAAMAILLGSK